MTICTARLGPSFASEMEKRVEGLCVCVCVGVGGRREGGRGCWVQGVTVGLRGSGVVGKGGGDVAGGSV